MLGKEVVDLYNATISGDHARAAILQKRLISPNQAVTKHFGVPGLKAAMEKMGYMAGDLRAPLCDLDKISKEKVLDTFKKNHFL